MTRRMFWLCIAAIVSGAACGAQPEELHGEIPYCDNWDTLTLEAQSVPTAELLPCLESLPLGWSADAARIDSSGTTIRLDSDRGGSEAVVVRLEEDCDVGEAIAVPTDEAHVTRFELVEQVTGGFRGKRLYLLDGACVTYEFDLDAEASAALVTEASAALTFVPREAVDAMLRESSEGKFGL